MDTPTLACTVYRDDVSSGWEIGNPLTTRFHSTLGFWKFTRRQTVRPEALRSLRHWAVCSPARRSTHFIFDEHALRVARHQFDRAEFAMVGQQDGGLLVSQFHDGQLAEFAFVAGEGHTAPVWSWRVRYESPGRKRSH